MSRFDVKHDHDESDFKRVFSPARCSLSALDNEKADELRRHAWTVTMIDEDPLAALEGSLVKLDVRQQRNKLRAKRRVSAPPPTRTTPSLSTTTSAASSRTSIASLAPTSEASATSEAQEPPSARSGQRFSRLRGLLELPSLPEQQQQPDSNPPARRRTLKKQPSRSAKAASGEKKREEKHSQNQKPAQIAELEATTATATATAIAIATKAAESTTTMRGPTVSVHPAHPATFGPTMDLYPVREDKFGGFRPRRDSLPSHQRMQMQMHRASAGAGVFPNATPSPPSSSTPAPAAPPFPDLASAVHRESMPTIELMKRQRKLSESMAPPQMTAQAANLASMAPRPRTASWGARSSYGPAAASVDPNGSSRAPAPYMPEYMFQRPAPIKRQTPRGAARRTDEVLAAAPDEVLRLMVQQLREAHLGPGSDSCATCWMRDACSISLTSRRWLKIARSVLYDDIQLVGPDAATHKKRFKLSQGTRLLMLRRTLRANPSIAALVRVLKVPAAGPELSAAPSGAAKAAAADYENLVASVVMACPSLERLDGLSKPYDHVFSRLFHALSTRANLREMNWLVQAPPQHQQQQQSQQQRPSSAQQQLGLVVPGELQPFQGAAFVEMHDCWSRLETLSVHCLPGAALAPEGVLGRILNRLPSLQHLHLYNVPANGFTDANLLALPPLQSLTLSHIPGITSSGLSTFATRANSAPLRKLHLRHTPLTSLAALARILSNLRCLESFALVQGMAPVMPEDDAFALWMMPYLASTTLRKLHWDITGHGASPSSADDILARSIAANGFPALHSLRVLSDPDGQFQDLCFPVERLELPTDRYRAGAGSDQQQPAWDSFSVKSASTSSVNSAVSPTRFLFKSSSTTSLASPITPASSAASMLSPSSSTGSFGGRYPHNTSLRAARVAAQARLEAAHNRPRFTVNIIDDDGTTTDVFPLAGFLGTAGSKIRYHLLPDAGSSDETGGLLDLPECERDGGENLTGGRDGCNGRWNVATSIGADRREKEPWWHTERGRWSRMAL